MDRGKLTLALSSGNCVRHSGANVARCEADIRYLRKYARLNLPQILTAAYALH
jgi:hypothetical protein